MILKKCIICCGVLVIGAFCVASEGDRVVTLPKAQRIEELLGDSFDAIDKNTIAAQLDQKRCTRNQVAIIIASLMNDGIRDEFKLEWLQASVRIVSNSNV